jgi:hypothetical protein
MKPTICTARRTTNNQAAMNSENNTCCSCAGKVAWAVAVIGAILIVVFLDRELKRYTAPPPLDAGRAEERSKTLAEIHNTEASDLDHTGWMDPTKGLVRLKIDDAMKLMEQKWKDPAAARKDLIARTEKANPPPPPPPPAKKSEFE